MGGACTEATCASKSKHLPNNVNRTRTFTVQRTTYGTTLTGLPARRSKASFMPKTKLSRVRTALLKLIIENHYTDQELMNAQKKDVETVQSQKRNDQRFASKERL